MGTYYDLLGVPPNATEMEIRSAYGRDVLRLQESSNAKALEFRSALDLALATLVDPAKRAEYDAQVAAMASESAVEAADAASEAFKAARNGGIAFAAGGLVTAGSYIFSDNVYFLAWGPLVFGALALVVGTVKYLGAGAPRAVHLMALGGLVAIGVVSAGYVGYSEGLGGFSSEAAQRASWNDLVDSTNKDIEKADDLVDAVAGREGWSAQDYADLATAATLYSGVANRLETATAPAELEWYRIGMAKNFREAAAIMRETAQLNESSPANVLEALDKRWTARNNDFDQLTARLDAQYGR